MTAARASDEVTDAIAHIEMHRQERDKEAGLVAACNEALRKLHELLNHEQDVLQRHDPGTRHPANVEAVVIEIKRVKKLMETASRGSISKAPQPGKHQVSWRSGTRLPARNKGRRTMGRRGDS